MDGNSEREVHDMQSRQEFSGSERLRSLSSDTILSAVANEHRRAILTVLDDARDKTLDFEGLVNRVADRVRDGDAGQVSDEQRRRVRIALHHSHLPKLDDARILDYEAETGHVTFVGGELGGEIRTLVDSYDDFE